jgi:hypothetical protein
MVESGSYFIINQYFINYEEKPIFRFVCNSNVVAYNSVPKRERSSWQRRSYHLV